MSSAAIGSRGVGVWGAPLRYTGAIGGFDSLPPDAFNRSSIGQRGGTTVMPVADVSGIAGLSSSSDPFNKQTAYLVLEDGPRPTTLRDGFSGGAASFLTGAGRTPVARMALTEAEYKERLGTAVPETPVSATPMTVTQAIEALSLVESTWPPDADEAGYDELVADAQRLKLIKGATLRRPITGDEQATVDQIMEKYTQVLESASGAADAGERAILAETARPDAERESRVALGRSALNNISMLEDDAALLNSQLRDRVENIQDLQLRKRELLAEFDELNAELADAVRTGDNFRAAALLARGREARDEGRAVNAAIAAAEPPIRTLGTALDGINQAAYTLDEETARIIADPIAPSGAANMRAALLEGLKPHERGLLKQAAAISSALEPQFTAGRVKAQQIADAQFDLLRAGLKQGDAAMAQAVANAEAARQAAIAQIGAAESLTGQLQRDIREASKRADDEGLLQRQTMIEASDRATRASGEQLKAIDDLGKQLGVSQTAIREAVAAITIAMAAEGGATRTSINNATNAIAALSESILKPADLAAARDAIIADIASQSAQTRSLTVGKQMRAREAMAQQLTGLSDRMTQGFEAGTTRFDELKSEVADARTGLSDRMTQGFAAGTTRFDELKSDVADARTGIAGISIVGRDVSRLGKRLDADIALRITAAQDMAALARGVDSLATSLAGTPVRVVRTTEQGGLSQQTLTPTLREAMERGGMVVTPPPTRRERRSRTSTRPAVSSSTQP